MKRLTGKIQEHENRELDLKSQVSIQRERASAAGKKVEEQSAKILDLKRELEDLQKDQVEGMQRELELQRRVEKLKQRLRDAEEALGKAKGDLDEANNNLEELNKVKCSKRKAGVRKGVHYAVWDVSFAHDLQLRLSLLFAFTLRQSRRLFSICISPTVVFVSVLTLCTRDFFSHLGCMSLSPLETGRYEGTAHG